MSQLDNVVSLEKKKSFQSLPVMAQSRSIQVQMNPKNHKTQKVLFSRNPVMQFLLMRTVIFIVINYLLCLHQLFVMFFGFMDSKC